MGDPTRDLTAHVRALQSSTAGLWKLLGGEDDDRDFWEIWKGLTTPAEWALIAGAFDGMTQQIDQIVRGVYNTQEVASQVAAQAGF